MKDDIRFALQAGGGVIQRRAHPQLDHRLDRLLASGELVSLLPGLLVEPTARDDRDVKLAAGLRWLGPDAVVGEYAAARLTFWPGCGHEELAFLTPHSFRPRKGWTVRRCRVPPEMILRRGRMPVTCPAYTAVDLCAGSGGGDIIDRALRSREATLPQMWAALASMRGRDGNPQRRRLLYDSRDKPWSELERAGHRLLRKHHLDGWRTNVKVATAHHTYVVDVLFEAHRLVVEFDGYDYHTDPDTFVNDRRRRNELVLAGYTVLNFTWTHVLDDPDWVIDCIRRAMEM